MGLAMLNLPGRRFVARESSEQRRGDCTNLGVAAVANTLCCKKVLTHYICRGLQLAFKRHELQVEKGVAERSPAYKLPLWIVGFLMMVCGVVLDFGSLALAAQVRQVPCGFVTIMVLHAQLCCSSC